MIAFDCTGLLENRMPGVRQQVKKVRLGTADEVMDVDAVVSDTDKDNSEVMLCQLLDARSDAMPLREGEHSRYFYASNNLVINYSNYTM